MSRDTLLLQEKYRNTLLSSELQRYDQCSNLVVVIPLKVELLNEENQFPILKEVIFYFKLSFCISDLQLDDISKMSFPDSVVTVIIIKCDRKDIISILFP